MATAQARKWCRHCRTNTLHQRNYFSFGVGCIVSLITGFVFLPFWLLLSVFDSFRSWHCQACGTSYRPSPFGKEKKPDQPTVIQVVVQQAPASVTPSPPKSTPKPSASKPLPAQPVPVEPVEVRERYDWAGLRTRLKETAVGCYRSVVETYKGLPDWATPIVWGLGVAAPIVTMMVAFRAFMR